MKKFSLSTWLLFLLPSIAGVVLFMTPLPIDGGFQIPIAYFASILSGVLEPIVHWIALVTLLIAAIGSIVFLFIPEKNTFVHNLFKVTPFWTVTRVVGAVFAVLIIFQLGPEAIWNENTGGMLLSPDGLVSFLFTIFLFAGLLLPLLLNFGLLEFFGTMMVKIMRPLFKLPGRSAVDALTSWVGDGTIGVLLTANSMKKVIIRKKKLLLLVLLFPLFRLLFVLLLLKKLV